MASKQTAKLSIEQLGERWRDHIDWIGEETNYITGHRTRYRLVRDWLVRPRSRRWSNRHLQAYGWISRLWLTEGLMSVRRQLDDQHGSVSLTQLLHEIESRPEALPGVAAEEVSADRQALQTTCAPALTFAQRQLAHRVPWDDAFVSMSALDAALDAIDNVVRKYHQVIIGRELPPSESEPDPDWLRSFEVAWNRATRRRPRGAARLQPATRAHQRPRGSHRRP